MMDGWFAKEIGDTKRRGYVCVNNCGLIGFRA